MTAFPEGLSTRGCHSLHRTVQECSFNDVDMSTNKLDPVDPAGYEIEKGKRKKTTKAYCGSKFGCVFL